MSVHDDPVLAKIVAEWAKHDTIAAHVDEYGRPFDRLGYQMLPKAHVVEVRAPNPQTDDDFFRVDPEAQRRSERAREEYDRQYAVLLEMFHADKMRSRPRRLRNVCVGFGGRW